MTRSYKIGINRFPVEAPNDWLIQLTFKNAPTTIVVFKDTKITDIYGRSGGPIAPKQKALIRADEKELFEIAQKRPFNAYEIRNVSPFQVFFETRPTKKGFKGRVIGYKSIADPSLRVRAGLHYVGGFHEAHPASFILEDPNENIILIPVHDDRTRGLWEDAVLDSISEAKMHEGGLSEWVPMDYIDSRDEYVPAIMKRVMKRIVQG